MKRALLLTMVAMFCLAQRSRDEYRAAYRAWREADPNLERESVAGGDAIAQRADRMASEAAKCAAARKAFLEAIVQDQRQQIASLDYAPERQPVSLDAPFVAAETASVVRMIDTFAADPDKGIQQLRLALARERTALDALGVAIAQRKKLADTVNASTNAIEQSRANAQEQSKAMLQGLEESSADTERETAAWAEYYRKVGEGAKGAATLLTEVQPGAPPATLANPAAAPPTVTLVPTARYIGEWTFPPSNGMYHGPQPEIFNVVVQEQNGHVKGTVSARFKLPSGSKGDPSLQFEFAGDFQPTRTQVFNLLTNDGTKGTIELIPGPAFNLLEINFQTDPKPEKVHQADAVLVKK